jgi:hypothetical protein
MEDRTGINGEKKIIAVLVMYDIHNYKVDS